jgi:dolichol-phosphate mannosyltransferase
MDYSKYLVVVPTYNEAENIIELVRKITDLYKGIKILVVDDSSPDGTFRLVIEEGKKNSNVSLLLGEKKLGFSSAYQRAFKNILQRHDVDWIIIMDADFSHSPEYIRRFIDAGNNASVVIGSRFIKGGSAPGMNLKRRMLSFLGNTYARIIMGIPIKDFTTGFIAFKVNVLPSILRGDMITKGFACLMEMKFKAVKDGHRWVEIPIVFGSRLNGYSKISWKIIIEGLITPWILRLKFKKHD